MMLIRDHKKFIMAGMQIFAKDSHPGSSVITLKPR